MKSSILCLNKFFNDDDAAVGGDAGDGDSGADDDDGDGIGVDS